MSHLPIVIDPGHGGTAQRGKSSPLGVRGVAGTQEKDVVLDLARRVAGQLGTSSAVLTRSDDINLSLGERSAVAQRYGAPVFVSLHANAGPGSGADVFVHARAREASCALARAIQHELAAFGGGGARSVNSEELAVLTPERLGPSTAACLLEVDYLGDPGGEQRLRDPHGRERIARAVARGIQRYMGQALRRSDYDEGQLAPAIVIGLVGVGIATFSLINTLEARQVGGSTWRRNVSRCTHTYPAGTNPNPYTDERVETILNIDCNAWMAGAIAIFGLYYRCNGNDIDQCRVDKYNSSDWTFSKLDVSFEGQDAVSYEANSVGAIMIYIVGTLDPVGSGDIDFSGRVLLKADGTTTAQGELMVTRGDPSDFLITQNDLGTGFYIQKR